MSRKADQDRRLILNLQQGDRLAVGLRSCARVMIIGPLATIIIVGLIALFEPDVRGPWATLTVITVLFSIIIANPSTVRSLRFKLAKRNYGQLNRICEGFELTFRFRLR